MLKYGTIALSVAMGLTGTSAAFAEYPEKPITLIVPAAPGGGTDVGVRTWVPFLEKCLGANASIVVVNKPGAGHKVGLTELANAAPDGYTLGAIILPNMIVSSVKATYNDDSFDYLGSFYASRSTISVRADSPYKSLKEVIDEAKSSGKAPKLGVGSIGNDDHLRGMQLAALAGVKIDYVPLGDAAPVRNALLGGHIDVVGLSFTETVPFKDEIRLLAITGDQRSPDVPDVPTFSELGFEVMGGSRHTTGAPKGLPAEVADKLSGCLVSIGKDQAFLDVAKQRSLVVDPIDAAQTADFAHKNYDLLMELHKTNPWD